jgi:hypothetical protein
LASLTHWTCGPQVLIFSLIMLVAVPFLGSVGGSGYVSFQQVLVRRRQSKALELETVLDWQLERDIMDQELHSPQPTLTDGHSHENAVVPSAVTISTQNDTE